MRVTAVCDLSIAPLRYMIVFSDVLMRPLKKSLFRLKLPLMLSTRACLV
jgi:hypothetical protein